MNWVDVCYIEPNRNSCSSSFCIEMILFRCLPAISINESQQPLWYWLYQSLARLIVLVDLSLYLSLTINLLILHPVPPVVLFIAPDPFFLSHSIALSFNLLSANCSMMIPLVWMRKNYSGVSLSTWPSLHYKYQALLQFTVAKKVGGCRFYQNSTWNRLKKEINVFWGQNRQRRQ